MKPALITGGKWGIEEAKLRLFLTQIIHVISTYQRCIGEANKLIQHYGSERSISMPYVQEQQLTRYVSGFLNSLTPDQQGALISTLLSSAALASCSKCLVLYYLMLLTQCWF